LRPAGPPLYGAATSTTGPKTPMLTAPPSASPAAPDGSATGSAIGRRDLIGLSRDQLGAELAALDEPAFRAHQLWHWIYHRGVTDFERMTTLAKSLRAKLTERYVVGRPTASRDLISVDATRKWLLRL